MNTVIIDEKKVFAYENEMCKQVGLRCTCNSCDRIVWKGEKYFEGGYCEDCAKDVKRIDGKPLKTIKLIS